MEESGSPVRHLSSRWGCPMRFGIAPRTSDHPPSIVLLRNPVQPDRIVFIPAFKKFFVEGGEFCKFIRNK